VPDWRIKATVQRAFGRLPRGHDLNYLFQRHVTRTAVARRDFAVHKLEQCRRHLLHAGDTPPRRVLEIGTGWFPFVVIGMALKGCDEVVTLDRLPQLRRGNVTAAVRLVSDGVREGWVGELLGSLDAAREAILLDLAEADDLPDDALARLGIHPVVGDAAAPPLVDASFDLVISNNTLEHVPRDALASMLSACRRLCRPSGHMSHFVDLSDHYSHFDPSISPLNFLRFDDRAWCRWDNPIVPQNRLRLADYRRAHEQNGFAIVDEALTVAPLSELTRVPLAAEFRDGDPDELRVTHAWFVSTPGEPRPA
jgi:SAM-dependent methyltransferase